jgi:hypothetical protein
MARPKAGISNRRGSPEAIAKRRAGRAFNVLLDSEAAHRLDGRTQKRRLRLIEELESGQGRGSRQPLKPLDLLSRLDELLSLGEPVAGLRGICRPLATPRDESALVRALADLHRAYGFRSEAYRLAGLSAPLLAKAGVQSDTKLPSPTPPRGRKRGLPRPSRRA